MEQHRQTDLFVNSLLACLFTLFLVFQLFVPTTGTSIFTILTHPALLQTDYFELGGLAPTFFNSSVLFLIVIGFIKFNRQAYTGKIVGYLFLLLGFSLFGKNPLNALPLLLGHQLYIFKHPKQTSSAVANAIVSTALGPMLSVLYFHFQLQWLLVLLIGLGTGYLFTPLAERVRKTHGGLTLYNGGLTAGFIAVVANTLLRLSGNQLSPYQLNTQNFPILLVIMAAFSFLLLIIGWVKKPSSITFNKESLDYLFDYGLYYCFYNMGLIGLMLSFFLWGSGAPINGISIGSAISVIGFGCYGKRPYDLLVLMTSAFVGLWLQGIQVQSATFVSIVVFSSALAPVVHRYPLPVAITAGLLHALVAPQASFFQGYMNLYNSGFTSGVVAIIIYTIDQIRFRLIRKEKHQPN